MCCGDISGSLSINAILSPISFPTDLTKYFKPLPLQQVSHFGIIDSPNKHANKSNGAFKLTRSTPGCSPQSSEIGKFLCIASRAVSGDLSNIIPAVGAVFRNTETISSNRMVNSSDLPPRIPYPIPVPCHFLPRVWDVKMVVGCSGPKRVTSWES